MDCPFEAGPRTDFVLSHPNHEVAVWGLVRRLRPRIIFLTDGGGGKRLGQTKESLAAEKIDAVYLGSPEDDYYRALLRRDHGYFRRAVARVAAVFRESPPARIFADAVEFYNPVHDLAVPIALAAAARAFRIPASQVLGRIPFFEVPLVHQDAESPAERYFCQKAPAGREGRAVRWELPSEARKAKIDAWTRKYTVIAEQMAPIVRHPADVASVETVLLADSPLREPGRYVKLRYEWRGKLLKSDRKVGNVITRSRHYLPVAKALVGTT